MLTIAQHVAQLLEGSCGTFQRPLLLVMQHFHPSLALSYFTPQALQALGASAHLQASTPVRQREGVERLARFLGLAEALLPAAAPVHSPADSVASGSGSASRAGRAANSARGAAAGGGVAAQPGYSENATPPRMPPIPAHWRPEEVRVPNLYAVLGSMR